MDKERERATNVSFSIGIHSGSCPRRCLFAHKGTRGWQCVLKKCLSHCVCVCVVSVDKRHLQVKMAMEEHGEH